MFINFGSGLAREGRYYSRVIRELNGIKDLPSKPTYEKNWEHWAWTWKRINEIVTQNSHLFVHFLSLPNGFQYFFFLAPFFSVQLAVPVLIVSLNDPQWGLHSIVCTGFCQRRALKQRVGSSGTWFTMQINCLQSSLSVWALQVTAHYMITSFEADKLLFCYSALDKRAFI